MNFTKGVVDRNKLDISSVTFAKDQGSFEFDYKSKRYSYNRLTGKLTLVEKKEEKKGAGRSVYSWMTFFTLIKSIFCMLRITTCM